MQKLHGWTVCVAARAPKEEKEKTLKNLYALILQHAIGYAQTADRDTVRCMHPCALPRAGMRNTHIWGYIWPGGTPPESHRGLSWGVPGSGFGPNRRTAPGISVPDRRTRLRPQFHSPRTQVCCVLRRVGMHPACHRGGNQKSQTQAIKISINEAGIHPAGALACVSEGVSC